MKTVVIVSAVRTPIGSFMGALSSIPAPKLGAIAIKAALEKINLKPEMVDEVLMGNVVQAGNGQAPARQAAIYAGIPDTTPCTTVNKVCASGMKAVMQAAQAISCGDSEIVVAGGMENMSLIPHYVHLRNGQKFGPTTLIDGMQKMVWLMLTIKMQWAYAPMLVPKNISLVEKIKMRMPFNPTNDRLLPGKPENLIMK